jgi:alkylhydroperoxidase family enzyme
MTTSTVTHLDGDSTAVTAVTGPDRWRVPSGPRVAPAVRFPFQPAMATNVLAMLRHRRLMAAVARSIAVSYVRASIGSSDRELVVLRTAWNCRAYFPYSAHLPFAWVLRRADEQAALQQGPDAPSWNGREAALLRAVDELHRDLTLSETTRAALRHHYDDREVQEIAFFVGLYETTSMVFDSMGFLVVQPLWRFVRRAPRDNHDDVQS